MVPNNSITVNLFILVAVEPQFPAGGCIRQVILYADDAYGDFIMAVQTGGLIIK